VIVGNQNHFDPTGQTVKIFRNIERKRKHQNTGASAFVPVLLGAEKGKAEPLAIC